MRADIVDGKKIRGGAPPSGGVTLSLVLGPALSNRIYYGLL